MAFRRWRDLDNLVARCTAFMYRERVVLVALLSFADGAGLCWPSLPRLAREARLGLATTKRALAGLSGAGIVARTGRSVFQIDIGRLSAVLAGEPDRLTREPMDRLTRELSIGSPVSREDPSHPSLNFKKGTHSVEGEPSVCAVDDLGGRVLHVARALALPLDGSGDPIVPPKVHDAIATALRSFTPAVLHRAVEMARGQKWREAELGAWCFTDESFLALVRKAQDEQRRRARARPQPEKPKEAPSSQRESVHASRNLLATLGVKRAG
jgi:hypothetical protein